MMSLTDRLLRNRIADRVGKYLTVAIQDARPDLVLVIKGRTISPDTLCEAKQILSDRPLVNFNPDSPWDPANKSTRMLASIPEYDAHFTWNKQLSNTFIEAGAKRIHYLPFAYDPTLHHPIVENPEFPSYDAVFVGTYSEERDRILGAVDDCDIRIVGNGWHRSKFVPKDWILSKAMYGNDALRALAQGVCAINILRPQNTGSHNMRTFEIPASGLPMLTTRSVEQSELFAEGREMECFDNSEELSKKIKALQNEREHAMAMAQMGYERVRDETYAKRARQMLELLGIGGGAA